MGIYEITTILILRQRAFKQFPHNVQKFDQKRNRSNHLRIRKFQPQRCHAHRAANP